MLQAPAASEAPVRSTPASWCPLEWRREIVASGWFTLPDEIRLDDIGDVVGVGNSESLAGLSLPLTVTGPALAGEITDWPSAIAAAPETVFLIVAVTPNTRWPYRRGAVDAVDGAQTRALRRNRGGRGCRCSVAQSIVAE